MKKLFIFLIPLLVFMSCKDSDKSSFTITGKITGLENENLILNRFTSEETIKLDTVVLNEKGEFTFKGNVGSPELFSLQINNDPEQIILLIDSLDNIVVNADGKNLRKTYTVSGSSHSILLKEMYDQLDLAFEKVDLLNRLYLEKKEKSDLDSLNEAIGKDYRTIIEDYKLKSIDFIDKNKTSPAVIMALYQSFGPNAAVFSLETDRPYFEKVYKSLIELYPNSELVIGLNQLLEANPPTPSIGHIAPEISQKDPDGKVITLSSLKGKYVLLDFWAAWCKPCRLENPTVLKNYQKYKKDNFTIYQVSLDRDKNDWVEAIEKDGLSEWYHVSDLQYWQSEAAALYGVRGIPANFLLDPEGKIIAVNLRGPYLGQKLQEIFRH